MASHEQHDDMMLLVVVTLICATLAGIWEIGQTRPANAARPADAPSTILAGDQPVRVILPSTPNTSPRER